MYIIIILALFALFNALVIRWQQGKDSATLWHITSFVIRAVLILQIGSIGAMLIMAFVAWFGYNTIINIICGFKWNYFGKYDFIVGVPYYILNAIILIIGILILFK